MEFQWDDAKDRANLAKHGISFVEASQLFVSGVDYLELYDELHSADEERFIALGPISRGIVLVVWMEPEDEVVRIVSARMATVRERKYFELWLGTQR